MKQVYIGKPELLKGRWSKYPPMLWVGVSSWHKIYLSDPSPFFALSVRGLDRFKWKKIKTPFEYLI